MLNEKGQTLIEFIIVYFFLFLCSISVIEIVRLISFKNTLQASLSFIAHKISYSQYDLIQNNLYNNKYLSQLSSNEVEKYLNKISTSLISFDNRKDTSLHSGVLYIKKHDVRVYVNIQQSGVSLEALTCLPVLFSAYFKQTHKQIDIGKTVKDNTRTCLGHFNSSPSLPLYWFRVKVKANAPWPASTQIFEHGLAIPNSFNFIEQKNRADILNLLKNNPGYFYEN